MLPEPYRSNSATSGRLIPTSLVVYHEFKISSVSTRSRSVINQVPRSESSEALHDLNLLIGTSGRRVLVRLQSTVT